MTGKMGGDNNAFTTNDATQYYFVAPSAYLDILLHIEATRMRGLMVATRTGHGERRDRTGSLARYFRPGFLASRKRKAHSVRRHRLRRRSAGHAAFVRQDHAQISAQFYNDWYTPNNAIFVIVGDVDPQATLAR
jgi:zinc protease